MIGAVPMRHHPAQSAGIRPQRTSWWNDECANRRPGSSVHVSRDWCGCGRWFGMPHRGLPMIRHASASVPPSRRKTRDR